LYEEGKVSMKQSTPEPDLNGLPRTIPIFPLNGALLLPGGRLPLNIFEPRYLAMVDDALTSSHRLIGMIQPNENENQDGKRHAIYETGCVGRISSFEETHDGRYLIALDGLIRFNVIEELKMKDNYRRVNASFDHYKHDMDATTPHVDRAALVKALETYFNKKGFTADWEAITNCDCEKLVNMLSMICPFGVQDKQALLEADTVTIRAQTLLALLEIENSRQTFSSMDRPDVRH
jgi:Lon protease-like protein